MNKFSCFVLALGRVKWRVNFLMPLSLDKESGGKKLASELCLRENQTQRR
jgi:hypothetical protein